MWKFIMGLLLVAACRTQAYVGAVASSTAESGRASVEATDVPYMNPAGLPFLKGYYFTTGYGTANDTATHGQQFSLSLIDNLPDTVVPTAVTYTETRTDFTSDYTMANDFRLAVGNFAAKNFALGVGLRYKDDREDQNKYTQINGSLSALYALNAKWGFAAVLDNVAGSKDNVPIADRLVPTTALGMNYIYKRVIRTRFDVVSSSTNSWDRPILEAGLEAYMNKWVVLRMGAQRDNELGANAYSAGLGFIGPQFALHYAYFRSPEDESLTRHALDLAIPIW